MSVEMVEAPVKSVTFVATRRGLRLVIEAKEDRFGPGGKKVGETTGKTVEFERGQFVANEANAAKIGLSVPELIETLRTHRLFGVADDGFLEVAPLVPDATPLLQELAVAAAARDIERVAEILAQEEQGHNREAVLLTAGAALQAFERDESPPPAPDGPKMSEIRERAKAVGLVFPVGTTKADALAQLEAAEAAAAGG